MGWHIQHALRGHRGIVVTHMPLTSEVRGSNPRPHVGKLVVANQWSEV